MWNNRTIVACVLRAPPTAFLSLPVAATRALRRRDWRTCAVALGIFGAFLLAALLPPLAAAWLARSLWRRGIGIGAVS